MESTPTARSDRYIIRRLHRAFGHLPRCSFDPSVETSPSFTAVYTSCETPPMQGVYGYRASPSASPSVI